MSQGTNKRKFVLPSLGEFQRKLEDFYTEVISPREKGKGDFSKFVSVIADYYQKGMSCRDIEKATGVNHQTIYYWLKRKGIQMRGPAGSKKGDNGHAENTERVPTN